MVAIKVQSDNSLQTGQNSSLMDLPLGERVERFSFAYSTKFENKELVVPDNLSAYIKGFTDTQSDLYQFMAYIRHGYAFCPALLGGKNRKKDNGVGYQLICLDVDNAIPKRDENGKPIKGEKLYSKQLTLDEAINHPFIQKHSCLIYTTPSHKQDWHKFRVVFLLPHQLGSKDRLLYEQMIQLLLGIIPGDRACSDSSRIFYGNTNAEFVLVNPAAALPVQFVDLAVSHLSDRLLNAQKKGKPGRCNKPSRDSYQLPTTTDFTQAMLIAEALQYIHPDEPYEDWLRVGMALHSAEDILPNAKQIWQDWAMLGTTYKHRTDRGSIDYRWAGFDQANHNVGLGSLFWLAERSGFTPTKRKALWKKCQRRVQVESAIELEGTGFRSIYTAQIDEILSGIPDTLIWPSKINTAVEIASGINSADAGYCQFKRYVDPNRQRFVNEHTFRLSDKYSLIQQRWDDALPDGSGRQFSDRKISYLTLDDQGYPQVWDGTVWGSTIGAALPPYRGEMAVEHSARTGANAVLLVEGVHIAEAIYRNLGIPAIGLPSTYKTLIRNVATLLRVNGLVGVYLASRKGSKGYVSFENRIDWIEKEFIRSEALCCVLDSITAEDVLKAIHYQGLEIDMDKGHLTPDSDEPIGYTAGHPLAGADCEEEIMNEIYQAGNQKLVEVKQRLANSLAASMERSRGAKAGKDTRTAIEHAEEIVNQYGHLIAWRPEPYSSWYQYNPTGYWEVSDLEQLRGNYIIPYYRRQEITPSFAKVNDTIKFLQSFLRQPEFDKNSRLMPFKNGVLDRSSNQFRPHQPGDYLTWQLPYDYEPLNKAVGGQPEDIQVVHLLVAYLAAVLKGANHLQRFMVCYGAPGSGKGTFLKLAKAIVGVKNTADTSIDKIESSQFNRAKLTEAKLVLVSELDAFMGLPLTLKALTGGDFVEIERKGKQQSLGEDKPAKGLFLMAGERVPTSIDTGGINRRQISVRFSHVPKPSERRDLLNYDADTNSWWGEFVSHLPSFFQLVLSYTDQDIRQLVLETDTYVPRLALPRIEALMGNSKLLEWIDECLYYSDEVDPKTGLFALASQIGKSQEPNGRDEWSMLYPSYRKWRQDNGLTKDPIAVNKFSSTLTSELSLLGLTIQLQSSSGKRLIRGLSVRKPQVNTEQNDFFPDLDDQYPAPNHPRIVSELFVRKLSNSTPESNPWNALDSCSSEPQQPETPVTLGTGGILDTSSSSSLLIEEDRRCSKSIVVKNNSDQPEKGGEYPLFLTSSVFQGSSSENIEIQTELKLDSSTSGPGEGVPAVPNPVAPAEELGVNEGDIPDDFHPTYYQESNQPTRYTYERNYQKPQGGT
jgi:hypothetical protein